MKYSVDEIMAIVREVLGENADGLYIDKDTVECSESPDESSILSNLKEPFYIDFDYYGEDYQITNGITKLVIIPNHKDYVIKIPFTAVYKYNDDGNYEFSNYISQDVLKEEINDYKWFSNDLKKIVLCPIYIGDYNNSIPIYIQEKVKMTALRKCEVEGYEPIISDKLLNKIESFYDISFRDRDVWDIFISELYRQFGIVMTTYLLSELEDIPDLHSNNFGYLPNGRCAVFDFGGYDSSIYYD